MSFKDQFYRILNNSQVQELVQMMFREGEKDPLFSDYFGINFLPDKIHSVKLYFTFNSVMPSDQLFRFFKLTDKNIRHIKENWKPTGTFERMHNGFTFSFKCYLKGDEIAISHYVGYRVKSDPTSGPQKIKIPVPDQQNYPGVCIEETNGIPEFKRYYFTESREGIHMLYQAFQLEQYGLKETDFSILEYAESDQECKINMIIPKAETVKNFLEKLNNPNILDLSRFFYTNYNLYYYCPGIRLNHPVVAIYYLPKESYHRIGVTDSLSKIMRKEGTV